MNATSANLAFVLLKESRFPDAESIVEAFPTFACDGERLTARTSQDGSVETSVLEFEVYPGGTAFVAAVPLEVPNGEADGGAQFSVSAIGTGWKLPPHKAHLVVTLRHSSHPSPVEAVSRFTSLLAAVAKASDAVGIYWGSARATHDASFFVATAESTQIVPRILLWTGVSIANAPDARLSLLSLGMHQLDLPDLLLIAPRSAGGEALETFFDLLAYVAERGSALPDGDTVGRNPGERLPVLYVPSPVDANTKVWRVELE
jgi:hypothetical protein